MARLRKCEVIVHPLVGQPTEGWTSLFIGERLFLSRVNEPFCGVVCFSPTYLAGFCGEGDSSPRQAFYQFLSKCVLE